MIASNYRNFMRSDESCVKILFISGTGEHLESDTTNTQRKNQKLRRAVLMNPPRGTVPRAADNGLIDSVAYDASYNGPDYCSGHYVAGTAVMVRRRRRRRGRRSRRPRRRFRRRGRRLRPRPVYSRTARAVSVRRRCGERLRTSGEHRRGCENSGYLSYSSPKGAQH